MAIDPKAREEVFAIFPELMDMNYKATACRTLSNGRMGRQLAARHTANRKSLVA